ncbi:uncharacterized protein BDR25DRAFT_344515 [Lindgomyces ingoldianus]|uniref:Uncharacterized protein n=1 Tax=Lindgomyces ingoldianus TaxID=673940 RepID=A0ACB6QMM6_9PLEO|nr:uncharacterized protein BDR25DRAFT_344515 [Lindgomyces ingoldianus]KAF2468238.1 hypothetical protein BDR25DRAFT_344515 [Lindgomyces ingoldianus]
MDPPRNHWDATGRTSLGAPSTWHSNGALPQTTPAFGSFPSTEYQTLVPDASLPTVPLSFPPYGDGVTAWSQEAELAPHFRHSQPFQEPRHETIPLPITQTKGKSKRPNRRDLPWDNHKQTMYDQYMKGNKKLKELQRYMIETHKFDATEKQYKDQFNDWGWSKNLGKRERQIMKTKAGKRRRENPPRDTEFQWGGQVWTVDRIMKTRGNENGNEEEDAHLDEPTPLGMTYYTPQNHTVPGVVATPNISPQRARNHVGSSGGMASQYCGIRLRWNGHTVADISTVKGQALDLERLNDFDGADEKFTEALEACRNLLPPADELRANITYQVARFYGRRNHMTRADSVLDELTDQFVHRWGQGHEKTLNHYGTVGLLLQAWDRHEDSLNLMRRLTDDLKSTSLYSNTKGKEAQSAINVDLPSLYTSTMLSGTSGDERNPASSQLVLQLEIENAAVTNLESIDRPEQRLLNLLNQLMKNPERNLIDIVRIRRLLVNLYSKSLMSDEAGEAFAQAKISITSLCSLDCSKTNDFFRAAVDLAEYGLEEGFTADAYEILEVVESEVVAENGPDHPNTISLLMKIGKMVQEMASWEEAEPRFQQAYAACITAFGYKSIVTQKLEKSLEKGSYLGDLEDDVSDKGLFQFITL